MTINVVELLRQFILPRSENGIRTSVPAMKHMLEGHGFQLSEETIRKTVTNMGFIWAPGRRRRVAAERPENILLRTQYLRMKRNNRDENNLPILPEVFIDESYVHLYHSAQKTWVHDVNDKLFGGPDLSSSVPAFCINRTVFCTVNGWKTLSKFGIVPAENEKGVEGNADGTKMLRRHVHLTLKTTIMET